MSLVEKSCIEWLHNKIGDDNPWSASNASAFYTAELLSSIASSFSILLSPVWVGFNVLGLQPMFQVLFDKIQVLASLYIVYLIIVLIY